MAEDTITPEGERLSRLALDLYSACRLPPPKVIVTDDPDRFRECVDNRDASIGLKVFLLVIVDAALFLLFGYLVRKLPYSDPFYIIAATAPLLGLLLFSLMTLLILVARFQGALRNPFRQVVEHADILKDALGSSGLPPADIGDVVIWTAERKSSWLSGDKPESVMGLLALELRRTTDAALLGDRHVLLLPAGSWRPPAAAPVRSPGPLARYRTRRSIRRLVGMEPAAAQDVFAEHGAATCMAALGATPSMSDTAGSLWDIKVSGGRMCWLQVRDPATGTDAWIQVPNHVSSPKEAVAWTYGLPGSGYAPTLEG